MPGTGGGLGLLPGVIPTDRRAGSPYNNPIVHGLYTKPRDGSGEAAFLPVATGDRPMEFFLRLFDTSDFPPRWACGRWSPGHGWLHVLSDLGVWSAYFAIPLALGYFITRRKDLPFRSIFLLFAAFIVLCGTTHLMEAVIFWWPAYRLAGAIKLLTAVVSWVTVVALIRVAPAALAMRSPDELEREIVARRDAERRLREANDDLERRVEERTRELSAAVADLRAERELLGTTLSSIGDAVITTDTAGRVTNLNPVAESLTGWAAADAVGQPLDAVFRIVNETTRQPVENPALPALGDGVVVGLANHTALIARDGTERPIEDSAAPIRGKGGETVGCVLVFRDVTARRESEARERATAERFRLAAEAVNGLIYEYDLATGHVERSRGLFEVVGVRPAEAPPTAEWWAERTHPDDRRRLALTAAAGQHERAATEYRVRHADGRWLHVEDRAVLVRDDLGRPVKLVGCTVDVTEKKRAEEDRQQAAAILNSLVASAPVGIVLFDADRRYRHLNEPLAEMNGIPAEAHLGKTVAEVVPDLDEQVRPLFDRVLVKGETVPDFILEGETPKAPGVKRAWRESWFPLVGVDGRPSGVGAIVQEITDQRRLERERENSQRTLATLVEQCPFGIYIVDADFRIASVNAGSQDKAFANVRPLIGRPFDEAMRIIWPEPVATDCINVFRHTLATGEAYSSKDFVNPRADTGETEGYEWELHRITLPDGRYGVVCYYFDATRLRQAERELREADRKKDEFVATLAHELRNPLVPIRNGLQVMKVARHHPEAVEEARGMMERQVGQLVHLIEDLMDLSRVSRGKVELRKGRVELAKVVQQAVETSRPLIEDRGHDLTVAVPADPIYVDGDTTRLAQVFANLLNNAAKYTDPGGRVRLAVERRGGAAVVSVTDNGVGIPAPMLPRVFDIFTQVDRSLEKAQGGLGIGLSLVKKLVELHGGAVEARSDGHRLGSEFLVTLPVVPAPTREAGPSDPGGAGPTSRKRRILVADDNADAAASLSLLLGLLGNEVRTANDGVQAVEAAETYRPDVVLLDIGMPKLNGLDACRRIRQQPWGQTMVLIALTGWGQEDDRRQTREAGFNHHLVKPVDPGKLARLLAGAEATA